MNLSSTGVDCSMGRNLMASGITLTNVSKLVLKLLTAPLIVENADNNRITIPWLGIAPLVSVATPNIESADGDDIK